MTKNIPIHEKLPSDLSHLYGAGRVDAMTDLETMDTADTAVITAIGFVFFDPYSNEIIDQFSANIDIESAVKCGRTMSAGTVKWWLRQNKEAQEAMLSEPMEHKTALRELCKWVSNQEFQPGRIWANSPSFDCAILRNAFDQLHLPWPFLFYNERDVRTIKDLAWPNGPQDVPNFHIGADDGIKHSALADTIAQARLVQQAYRILQLGLPEVPESGQPHLHQNCA